MIYLIIVGVVLWYGIGLLGSAIGLGSIAKHLEVLFPALCPHDTKGDKLAGYLLAIGGIGNLGGALLFCAISRFRLSPRWEWLK